MLTSDFDFPFPQNRIALRPVPRGEAKLMVVSKSGALPGDFPLPVKKEGWAFGKTSDLIRILKPGDALALNDTKVLRARLRGRLQGGGACEVLLLKPRPGSESHSVWECLAKPGRKLIPGGKVEFASGFHAEVLEIMPEGERVLRFGIGGDDFLTRLEQVGETPLPPYIRRPVETADAESYQSIFAENSGSVAAPTASLHFSPAMIEDARNKGVGIVKLTLHVGAGTFRPVQTERAEEHPMHSEAYSLPQASTAVLNTVRAFGGRVFAVGTTTARVLETCSDATGMLRPQRGETDLFIRPGYAWKSLDALFTNFHWPKSTLFMLVCALMGTERAKAAYAEAMRREFRLFSYGDAMLIL